MDEIGPSGTHMGMRRTHSHYGAGTLSGRACVLLARVTGLEPATSGVTGRRSNQLSYTRSRRRGVEAARRPVKTATWLGSDRQAVHRAVRPAANPRCHARRTPGRGTPTRARPAAPMRRSCRTIWPSVTVSSMRKVPGSDSPSGMPIFMIPPGMPLANYRRGLPTAWAWPLTGTMSTTSVQPATATASTTRSIIRIRMRHPLDGRRWAVTVSNRRPSRCKRDALPLS